MVDVDYIRSFRERALILAKMLQREGMDGFNYGQQVLSQPQTSLKGTVSREIEFKYAYRH
jgi:hypothetical protein